MPDYRHKALGFTLREDAYLRRVAEHEFAAADFEEVVDLAPVAEPASRDDMVTPVVTPALPALEVPTEQPVAPLLLDLDDDEDLPSPLSAKKAPPKRRR